MSRIRASESREGLFRKNKKKAPSPNLICLELYYIYNFQNGEDSKGTK